MANTFKEIDEDELIKLAYEYCDSCINSTKEIATVKGPVKIVERRIPTIKYFLEHYLRVNHFEFYQRRNWYDAKSNPEHPISLTIKKIDEMFEALAVDVVANEGKGIFYAKNKLGMTDRIDQKIDNQITEIIVKYEDATNTH